MTVPTFHGRPGMAEAAAQSLAGRRGRRRRRRLHTTTSGSPIGRPRCSQTRRDRSGRPRRRCSSSIRPATLVSSWGGPGAGYEWPQLEHGIYVDDQDNVWLGAGGDKDAHILKFTRDGRFLMQIGHQGKGAGQQRHAQSRRGGAHGRRSKPPTSSTSRTATSTTASSCSTATTGAYKRHWGAYGKRPDDSVLHEGRRATCPARSAAPSRHENKPSQYDPNGPPPPQFRIVHAVRISHDGLVYVCDRTNDRLQVFRKDGTFVKEAFIAKDTFGSGSVWDIGFSVDPEQTFAIVPDGTNQQVYVVRRSTLEVVSTFGGAGHWAGQFYGAHNLAVDSKGRPLHHRDLRGKTRPEVRAPVITRASAATCSSRVGRSSLLLRARAARPAGAG